MKELGSFDKLLNYINQNYVLGDIKEKFKIFKPLIKEISEKLGKVVSFEINGEKLMVDLSHYETFLNSSVHIIRNMLDHGLETEEERVQEGKPGEGKIQIEISSLEKSFKIIFKDDGRGINLAQLKSKIIKNGLAEEEEVEKMKPEELYQFIFIPQFSTRNCQ